METWRPRVYASSRLGGTWAAFLLAFGVASCKPDAVVHAPEIVGVVRDRTLVDRDLRFEFVDGRVFTSLANMDYVGGSQPVAGDLLLAGHSPELWVYRAMPERQTPPNEPICYALFGPTRINGTEIIKTVQDAAGGDFTLRFPKAPAWADFGSDGDRLFGVKTCINEAGQAFAQRPASAEG